MVTYLIEALLASNGNIDTTSIFGTSRTNQSRIFAPGMHRDISGRDDVRRTVRNDVCEADKLDITVDGPTTDERSTASSRIEECAPKSIFRKDAMFRSSVVGPSTVVSSLSASRTSLLKVLRKCIPGANILL